MLDKRENFWIYKLSILSPKGLNLEDNFFFGKSIMERRSARLAILQILRPISYRETGVRRVFKRIRRKRHFITGEAKRELKVWKGNCPQRSWSAISSESEDSVQPCCSKTLQDQSHLLIQDCFESPPVMETSASIILCQDHQPLVLEEHPRPIMKVLAFPMIIFMLGICSGFVYGLCNSSDTFKQVMKVQLSRQNEALQQHLQKQIGAFRQDIAGLQNFVDALGSVGGHWETQKHLFKQVDDSKFESSHNQKEDFAQKSAGASIVKFSKSFDTGARVCMLGFCWDYSRAPDVILERDNSPGNCWAMHGSQGYVVIKLSQSIFPAAVALDHISKTISHTEEITSAPKTFSVYGFKDDFEKEEGNFLGSFVYRIDGFPMQMFKLEGANLDPCKYLLLKILSNWDHPNYTCIYGFRVYGE